MLACCGIINFDISFFRGIIGCACEGFEKIKWLRKQISKTECRVGDYPQNVI